MNYYFYNIPRRMRCAGHVARKGKRGVYMVFLGGGGNLRERDHLGEIDGRIMTRWIFRTWEVVVWNGSNFLRIGKGGGYL